MAFHYCLLGVLMPLSLLIAQAAAITEGPQLALPHCPYHCGNLAIPYPFGMGEGCYLRPEFNITCDQSTQPPSAHWTGGTNRITNFSVADGELQIMLDVAKDCYDNSGEETEDSLPTWLQLPPPYSMSHTKNNFTTVGCDTIGIFLGELSGDGGPKKERVKVGNSVTFCDDILGDALPDSCAGIGCSQASIPGGLRNISTYLQSLTVGNRTGIYNWWYAKYPCSYAFIVEQGTFSFNPKTTFEELNNSGLLPAVLNWAVEGESCDAAKQNPNFPCKENAKCVERTTIGGPPAYICQCSSGYRGNPYLPDGCQDIDECKESNPCSIGTCENFPGEYSCKCPEGYKNDGKNQKSCIKHKHNPIHLCAGVTTAGLLVLLIGISWIYWGMHRRRLMKLKEKYFKENGGLLLQQQLASQGSSMETTKIFAAEELEKATDNYHESRVVGEGGYGIVYKGILADNKVVAIKKSKVVIPAQKEQFVNEVIVLSQINHRNVVRLLGCCLETPVPLLVYEYITNGTLFHRIHGKKSEGSSLSWELRLKIAAETAGALAYLHSSTATPIIHRDVKAINILLDGNYMAKVSDFGASRLVPMDQTQVTTLVQGTRGYLDPEYLHSNQLTQKSDVYSFGVVLMELLTSKLAFSFARPESERNLASFFVCSMEEDGLNRIWDDTLFGEGNIETLKNVANLAKRCVSLKGEERPTMKEAASELEGMRIMAKHPWKSSNFCPEETVHLLGSPSNTNFVDVRGDCGSSGHDSMQIQMLMSYNDGR
ncbi:PREDICTED: wall-associated receptor kinase 1-like [Prunus mume]|uniref:Wall-associated receptor kinase 1-like n=1 Tax=Prunus mume TaxID=102107 RepID=A0ABM1LLA3_PRUMU|nr:PREDICTED: wall-associated receptor kinase 1-like [Prunus mume]